MNKQISTTRTTESTPRLVENNGQKDHCLTEFEAQVHSEIETNEDNNVQINTHFYQLYGLVVLVVTFGILGVWSAVAPLSGAIVAQGFVVAASNAKEVQHLKGGIIEKIYVKEGDIVKINDPIIKLNDTQEKAELDLVKTQYYEAIGNIARLDAQLNEAKQISFPDELLQMENIPQKQRIIANQTKMFQSLTQIHKKTLLILEQSITQTEKQIEGLQNRVQVEKQQAELYQTEISERRRLYKLKLDSKVRLKEMERDALSLQANIHEDEAEILRLSIKLTEIRNKILLEKQNYVNQLVSDLQKFQTQQIDLKVRWLALEDTLKRTLVRSPGDGAIVGFEIDTIGAVVSPGALICEVIPQDKKFAIKAKIRLIDIDKVYPSQPVDIRFSAFNTRFTRVISGNVVRVSADSLEDNEGNYYYEAKIVVNEKGYEIIKDNEFEIIPGMPVEAMIKIEERTFLSYLLKPFQDMLAHAFNEE